MVYVCDVCKEKVSGDSIVFISHTEQHIFEIIKKQHPQWIEKNGVCQKCLEYYRTQLKGQKFDG